MFWARRDVFVLPMILLRLPSILRWLQASSMPYELPFRMEWHPTLLLPSTMTTSATPSIYGRTLNSGMIPKFNHANVVLFEVKKLLSLHLDPNVVPTKFITDFNKCLLRLKKNKAGLAMDTDTLRVLLLVVIQDEQFEPVRDTIVKEPTKGMDEILKDLHDREISLQIKDSAHAEKPIWLARHAQGTYTRNTYYSPSAAVKGWRIPRFPNSWKMAFGPKLFQMLINWRTAAHKKTSQEQLNEDFATLTVEYTAHQHKQKSCHAEQSPPEPEGPVT